MKFFSYNCRGLPRPDKKLALCRLLKNEPLDIIFLQETLGRILDIAQSLQNMLPRWILFCLDAHGRSGGLALGYRTHTIKLHNCWGGMGHLGVDISSAELGIHIWILNVYGLCQNKPAFWQNLLSSDSFKSDHLILGGDLNFSIGHAKSWGHRAQRDSLSNYFLSELEAHHLIDIPSAKPQATCRNNRTGDDSLARRLDRFLVKEKVLDLGLQIRHWVRTRGISDHLPIYLEIVGGREKPKGPFKFCSVWIKDDSYKKMISDFWRANPPGRREDSSRRFIQNLIALSKMSKLWAHNKRTQEDQTLCKIEADIVTFENNLGDIYSSEEHKDRMVSHYAERAKILKEKEESWPLRSRAIWMLEGDENTKFYHKFANGRKAINTIWQLQNDQGYVDPGEEEDLIKAVTLEELEHTLKWFKKDKSPGPDGWSVEFYLAFFDIIREDLLRIIEDSRSKGFLQNSITSPFLALIPKKDNPDTFEDFHPISLCNCIYKIIANRLKPILSNHISPEQFAFPQDRQIHEAIGTAQEVIYTLHSR
eukprot:PITA_16512